MLFRDRNLKSKYDFGTIECSSYNFKNLCSEIIKLTQTLQTYHHNRQELFVYDLNEKIRINLDTVDDATWYRSENEISEILHRNLKNGKEVDQFSISKIIRQTTNIKNIDLEDIKILKLLYSLYIINYFIFPKKNIFNSLSKNTGLHNSNEDIENGYWLNLIINDMLSEVDLLKSYDIISDNINSYIELIDNYCIKLYEIENIDTVKVIDYLDIDYNIQDRIYYSVVEEFLLALEIHNKRIIYSGFNNILLDLEKDLFFDSLKIYPDDSWKKLYLTKNQLDSFLKSDELYKFCKQIDKKIVIRDKQKFLKSKAVDFLKEVFIYDMKLMELYGLDKGLFLELKNNVYQIYALRAAVIIKSYNDLINKRQVKITISKNKNVSFRSFLQFYNKEPILLILQVFKIACISQYINITNPNEYHELFYKTLFYPKIVSNIIIRRAFILNDFSNIEAYLVNIIFVLKKLFEIEDH